MCRGWDGTGWDGTGWDEKGCDRIRRDGMAAAVYQYMINPALSLINPALNSHGTLLIASYRSAYVPLFSFSLYRFSIYPTG